MLLIIFTVLLCCRFCMYINYLVKENNFTTLINSKHYTYNRGHCFTFNIANIHVVTIPRTPCTVPVFFYSFSTLCSLMKHDMHPAQPSTVHYSPLQPSAAQCSPLCFNSTLSRFTLFLLYCTIINGLLFSLVAHLLASLHCYSLFTAQLSIYNKYVNFT